MESHRGLTLTDFEGPLVEPEDVLISFDGTPGRVAFGLKGYYSSGVRRALSVGRPIPTSLIWAMLSGESVQGVISEYATGTTIQHAGSALPHLTAPLLSAPGFSWFENEGENLWRYILGLLKSSETLFSLRTSLSLEMLSGRMRVKDASSMVESV
jgi:type I restriction enzyme S subunit